MHKYFLILGCLFISLAGGANPGSCFKSKKTISKAVSQSKITDDVILLKRKGYFKSYTILLGLRINKLTGTYRVKEDSVFLNICIKRNVSESYAFGTINKGELHLFFPDKMEEKRYVLYDIEQLKQRRRKAK